MRAGGSTARAYLRERARARACMRGRAGGAGGPAPLRRCSLSFLAIAEVRALRPSTPPPGPRAIRRRETEIWYVRARVNCLNAHAPAPEWRRRRRRLRRRRRRRRSAIRGGECSVGRRACGAHQPALELVCPDPAERGRHEHGRRPVVPVGPGQGDCLPPSGRKRTAQVGRTQRCFGVRARLLRVERAPVSFGAA